MAGDLTLDDQTRALEHELSVGLELALYDVGCWVRAQTLADGIGRMLAAGGDRAIPAAMLDRLPPPRNARERVLAHLIRATALGDGHAPTAAILALTADLATPEPRHSLIQADYILRAMIFNVWSNRLGLADPGAHDLALRRLWHVMLDRYRAAMPGRVPVPPAQRQRDLIVVMTGQFVRGMHQPSIDILDFVSKLVLRFGRRVVLINTADGPDSVHYPYLGGFTSTADGELVGKTQLMIDRLPIPFIHLPAGFTDPESATTTRDRILDLRPDLILSFGTLSPVADLCQGLVDVVAIPFGSYIPFAEPTWLALPRPLAPSDVQALAIGGLVPEKVAAIDYSYAPPAIGVARTKADLGVPPDAILAVIIGLRLPQEVTPTFAAALDAAVRAEPRLFFLFVGVLGNYADIVAPNPALAARSRAHGHEADVMGVLEAADLYINPPRGGGGTSAAYALSRGVPAYSLNMGDVATVVGPAFHLASYADFAPAAARFTDDAGQRQDLQEKARKRFAEISSREVMLHQILDGVKKMRAKG